MTPSPPPLDAIEKGLSNSFLTRQREEVIDTFSPSREPPRTNGVHWRTIQQDKSDTAKEAVMLQGYDGLSISSMVSEKKNLLWEIKNFPQILEDGVLKACKLEFEMGRLGSIDAHLPRLSKWRLTLDLIGGTLIEITVHRFFPMDKVIFYKFHSEVMSDPRTPTNLSTGKRESKFREAIINATSGNSFMLKLTNSAHLMDPVSCLSNFNKYLRRDGSLLLKIEMEVMEDSSS